jgi:DNA-binding SARP family transcriptional activator
MRRRRHPHLPRVAAAGGVLLALGALAALGRFRPPLPHISSLTGPLTSTAVQDGVLCLAWLLSVYLALVLLARAARTAIQGPAWQREAILPGVIPAPPPPRPPTPLSERFQPPFRLTLTPRPNTATPPAFQAAAVAEAAAPAATLPAPQPQQPGPPTEPVLSVSVLGPLRIDGTKRPPKRVPTRELIAYLALHPHGASRDELTEALWPAQDPKKTRPRLWESATDARAALGDAWIVEGERYRLDRTKVQIDLDQLDALLASGNPDSEAEPQTLEAALALWRGEPLEGSDYAWADGHIHRLRATLIGLLERAGHARLECGDARGALQLAEQAIRLDQFHEASWRLALQADHALGLRESITRRYDDLAKALDQELGLQPTRETRVMYRELLGQD